jgi:hypothetical protein
MTANRHLRWTGAEKFFILSVVSPRIVLRGDLNTFKFAKYDQRDRNRSVPRERGRPAR